MKVGEENGYDRNRSVAEFHRTYEFNEYGRIVARREGWGEGSRMGKGRGEGGGEVGR